MKVEAALESPAIPRAAEAAQNQSPAIDARLRGHMPALDGVRGLAILMVLLLHFVANTVPTNPLERLVGSVCTFGIFGVDLFFVLSGFLITGILIDARQSTGFFRNFYMRRALRIFPLYYAVLIAVCVIAPLLPWLHSPDLELLQSRQGWAWLYSVNILTALHGDFAMPYLDHFWSLSVEEHFYLFWPFVVWVCPPRSLLRVALGLSVLSLLARIAMASHVAEIVTYVLTPFRLDSLCFGAFLAASARRPNGLVRMTQWLKPLSLASFALFMACWGADKLTGARFPQFHQLRAAGVSMLLAMLMLAALTAAKGTLTARAFSAPSLRFLGKYSYGLYVFHHLISFYLVQHKTEFAVTRWVGSHTLAVALQASFGVGVSILIAVASYHCFEKPFIAMKRYWSSAATPKASVTSAQ
jgi:peptidoglycan/LPS O-acetylase OafA/YrhL